jgi:hypothetical protein
MVTLKRAKKAISPVIMIFYIPRIFDLMDQAEKLGRDEVKNLFYAKLYENCSPGISLAPFK